MRRFRNTLLSDKPTWNGLFWWQMLVQSCTVNMPALWSIWVRNMQPIWTDTWVPSSMMFAGYYHRKACSLQELNHVDICRSLRSNSFHVPHAGRVRFLAVMVSHMFEYQHTLLLRSDGKAVAFGTNICGQCNIPPLDEGKFYTQVSAGASHSVLLRSDGLVVACGLKDQGRCSIPVSWIC